MVGVTAKNRANQAVEVGKWYESDHGDAMNNYVDAWEQVKNEFACSHPVTIVTFRVKSNGAVNYFLQCTECWDNVKHLRGADLTDDQRQTAVPFDDQKRTQRYQQQNARFDAVRNQLWKDRKASFDVERNAYMQTAQWRMIRAKVLKRCGGICEGCGDRPATQVHHLTYERLGHEMLFDLVGLCRQCHESVHGIGR